MLGDKDGYLALGIALGFMGALAAFVWINGVAELGYCGAGENYGACVREWIGASSGWAAAFAAGITIFALYYQIKEQRKQTEFVLGDAAPTVDVIGEDFTRSYIQIVNWNRRALLVDNIQPGPTTPLFLTIEKVELNGAALASPGSLQGQFLAPIRVPGWIDRSGSPPVARFQMRAFSAGSVQLPRRIPADFEVSARVVGEEHKTLKLHASAKLNSF
ncbi:hypothetical protein NKJ51_12480 [Mesorhizobium sp. M0134]|uniref:hypothetical protein n=1 Tax=Mesorhizobium sp. M0134 TaxID=2956889 RepID=UPI0033393892